jgi:transcriptional repressor NrdR
MRCPFCSSEKSEVRDSRPTDDHSAIRRRRVCAGCGARFTTFERIQLRDMAVIKSDGKMQPFDREKIARSMTVALRKRPVDAATIEQAVTGIVRQLENEGENEIPARHIGESVMRALTGLDTVGYIRYASVYKDFRDSDDFNSFLAELQDLKDQTVDRPAREKKLKTA